MKKIFSPNNLTEISEDTKFFFVSIQPAGVNRFYVWFIPKIIVRPEKVMSTVKD